MSIPEIATVDARQAAGWLAAGEAILVDVREPDEFAAEHIPNAASVPLATVAAQMNRLSLPQGTRVVFQCQKGARGARACAIGSIEGHDVYNLGGGIEAWRQAGLPVIAATQAAPSIFRQVQIIVGAVVALLVLAGFAGHPSAFALAGLVGAVLAVSGVTGWCGLALLLGRMPWNRPA